MTLTSPIRICVVEDEPTIRAMLTELFGGDPGLHVVRSFATAEAAMRDLPVLAPHVVLSDISLPGVSGIDLVRDLAPEMPGTLFLMYTMHDDDRRVFDALRAGAHGYLLKSSRSEEIIAAVKELAAGGSPMSTAVARRVIAHFHPTQKVEVPEIPELTDRENAVLKLLAEGLLYKEIGDKLGITSNTVGQHVHRIYGKLHVGNRTEAVNKYFGR